MESSSRTHIRRPRRCLRCICRCNRDEPVCQSLCERPKGRGGLSGKVGGACADHHARMGCSLAATNHLIPFSVAFLVGFPRSGTTLADTFLMGHRDCFVIEEVPLLNDVTSGVGPMENLPDADPDLLAQARKSYLDKVQAIVGDRQARLVIDKSPLNMLVAPVIHSLFPGAPVIFVQRHPCDAVLSGFMQSFEPNIGMASFLEIEEAAEFYDQVMRVWDASRRALN